jgi:hypothetical protein
MGGIWEFGGYLTRIFAVQDQRSGSTYTIQQLLILLAPLWINAYIYMLLGRMVHFFLRDNKVFGLKAQLITKMFVLFDIIAFLIQMTGGMMSGSELSDSLQKAGLNIYIGGLAVQLAFLTVFVSLAIEFQKKLKRQEYCVLRLVDSDFQLQPEQRQPSAALARRLSFLLYLVMALVLLRNIYRLVEFSLGKDGYMFKHEWFAYAFDAVPMLWAMLFLNIVNPGTILQGPRSDFSEESKAAKKAKKEKKDMDREVKQQLEEQKRLNLLQYTVSH